jgi:hypothetical protein
MSDGNKNMDQPQKQGPQRRDSGDAIRKEMDAFQEKLQRIREDVMRDVKKSSGLPKEDVAYPRREGFSFPQETAPSSFGGVEAEIPVRASETAGPSAPGDSRIKVSGEPLAQHREKRAKPDYAPANDTEALMDAKDAGQYHIIATAGGMSESAQGAMGLDGIRKVYHELGQQAAGAGDPKDEVNRYYPKANPSKVEKGMVNQTAAGMKILKEAFKDGYTGRSLKTTEEMLQEQQGQNKGAKPRPSGIFGGLLNRIRGSSDPGPGSMAVAGVRGSQTQSPEVARASRLLRGGYLGDEDLDEVLSLLDSNDQTSIDRLRLVLKKYPEDKAV